MRIRKRSIAALASSSPSNKAGTLTCTGQQAQAQAQAEAAAAKEKEFLLPLVAAVMDVQSRAEFGGGDAAFTPATGPEIAEISPRPVHKWRNTLLRCNAESEDSEAIGEAEKSISRWNGFIRPNRDDKSGLLTREACAKDGMSRSLDEQQELGEADRPEKCLDLQVAIVKKQRSKVQMISHVNAEAIKMNRKETQTIHRDLPQKIKKSHESDNNSNVHAGSQCRRRNGRGWRCSERTLVGYFLCEHHLGKGRLKSINSNTATINDDPHPALLKYNKAATKFKELYLIHAAAPPL